MLWSFETVAVFTSHVTAVLLSVSLYVFLVSRVFPDLLLKPRYDRSAEGDRGIRRYTFERGRAIVYVPSAPYRKYLKQYILSERRGEAGGKKKYLQCQFAEGVSSVRYEAVAFDGDDRLIDTFCAEEYIFSEQGISRAATLPARTAYVKVILRSVNGVKLGTEKIFYLSAARKWGFAGAVTLGLIAETLLLRSSLLYFAGLFFGYSDAAVGFGVLFAVASALGLGAVLSAWLLRILLPDRSQIRRGK